MPWLLDHNSDGTLPGVKVVLSKKKTTAICQYLNEMCEHQFIRIFTFVLYRKS